MPTLPISLLPAAAALTGGEQLPAVQDGTTVRASVAQLRAGLADASHSHATTDVTGLTAALAEKRALGRRSLWLPADALTPAATDGAASGTMTGPSHGAVLRTLDFADGAAATAHALFALPKAWDRGTLSAQPLWTAESGGGDVVWSVAGVAIGDGEALDAAPGAAVTCTDTLTATGALHAAPPSPALTLAGLPAAAPTTDGPLLSLSVSRAVGDSADTLDAPARLLGLRIGYRVNAASDD